MNIWFPAISTGTGAEVYTKMLASGLEARGHQVALQFAAHRYQYAPWAARLRPPFKPDVTLANSWNAAAFSKYAPLVTVMHHVVHGPDLAPFKTFAQRGFHAGFIKPMEQAALRKSDAVVAVSESTRTAIAESFGFKDAHTVLNGVETEYFTPSVRGGPTGVLKLLFVGKPSRRKGFDIIARLAAHLGDRASLTVIGSDPEAGIAVPECDFRGRVSRDELREAYRAADFLLLPSHVEGFGYAAAEAMSCGTPVVCAPHGAVAEISQIGRAGLALDANSVAATATEMLRLRQNEREYQAMREAAREIALLRLDHTRWLDEMEAILRQAAGA